MPTWAHYHQLAMECADLAAGLAQSGQQKKARDLFKRAEDLEMRALLELHPSKAQTIKIMQNSVRALRKKAKAA